MAWLWQRLRAGNRSKPPCAAQDRHVSANVAFLSEVPEAHLQNTWRWREKCRKSAMIRESGSPSVEHLGEGRANGVDLLR